MCYVCRVQQVFDWHLEFLYRLEMDNLIADINMRQVKVNSTNHTVV